MSNLNDDLNDIKRIYYNENNTEDKRMKIMSIIVESHKNIKAAEQIIQEENAKKKLALEILSILLVEK